MEIDRDLRCRSRDRVRAIQEREGRQWVFVEASETGVPMDEAVLVEKGRRSSELPSLAPTLPLSQLPPATRQPVTPGARREIFALDEGDVVLTFPDNLSAASFRDLEGYLQLFLRKAHRRAGAGDYFAQVYAPNGITAKGSAIL